MTTNCWEPIGPKDFLEEMKSSLCLDVRSEKEFESGHIPGAFNLPILNNEERIIVGTLYKQKGRHLAYIEGMKLVGPRLHLLFERVEEEIKKRELPVRKVIIYCWRGGLRSQSVNFLLKSYGIKTTLLQGGYKNYRHYIRQSFFKESNLVIVGGYTGSGKSFILKHLQEMGEQVLDLEDLAKHKGSAFGTLGETNQPTNEQFENNLYQVWEKFDFKKRIFIEDESRSIGKVQIPDPLFMQMRNSRVLFIDIPQELRSSHLASVYGKCDATEIINCLSKIQKKMGGQNFHLAMKFITNNEMEKAANLILHYYDKTYFFGLKKREENKITHVPLASKNHQLNAHELLKYL